MMKNIYKALALMMCLAVFSGCMQNPTGGRNTMKMNRSLLEPMVKSGIRIVYDMVFDGECPVGGSKIGGKPDLPAGFEWFYYMGEAYGDGTKNRPLAFLAQINCEEASEYDKDTLLPSKGMLYFFYEMAAMTWGFDPKDTGSARVYYFPGDKSELCRTDFPSDLSEEYTIPEIPVSFSPKAELPNFEEFIEWHEEFDGAGAWDRYDELKIEMGFDSEFDPEEEDTINKLLGYANVIQHGMLLECELVSGGVCLGGPDGYANVTAEQKENCTKWQLLFQLDSIDADGFEMLWGDSGRLYFYINSDDLAKQNFDNCWLILQCY